MNENHIQLFTHALEKCGIIPRTPIIADGKLRRFATPTDPRGKKSGWYRLTIVGDIAFGAFGAWAGAGMSINEKYFSKNPSDYSEADRERIRARQREAEEQEKAEHAKAAVKAQQLWARAKLVTSHPYADSKGITLLPDKVRMLYDKLVVPMYHDFEGKTQIVSLQFISADGTKRFLTNARKIGCYTSFNKADDSKEVIYIAEGYATAASVYEATGLPVVVAFDAGNLKAVAAIIRGKYPDASIIIAADNDQWTRKKDGKGINNPGVTKAREAAITIGAGVVWPHFAPDSEGKPTDFNDLHQREGLDAVRNHLQAEEAGLAAPPTEDKPEPKTPPAPVAYDAWKNHLIPGKAVIQGFPNGFKPNSRYNAGLFVQHHEKLVGVFIYNEFSDQMMIARCPPWENHLEFKPHAISDNDFHELSAFLELSQIVVGKDIAADCAISIARKNKVNPPRDYFDSLKWDGAHRLDKWLSYYLGAESQPPEYLAVVGSKWLIGAAKRIYEPGCKFDTVLILEGKQGIGKSNALQALATFNSEKYFLDAAGDLRNKDTVMGMQGKVIVELAELASFKKAENEDIKAFITRQTDEYRPPYGRTVVQRNRYFVLAASTNETDGNYLIDETGNRRYWPVRCGESIDIASLNCDKEQLWAEAVYRYKQGEAVWVCDNEKHLLETEQADRQVVDTWETSIRNFLHYHSSTSDYFSPDFNHPRIEPLAKTSVKEVLQVVLKILEKDQDQKLQTRVAKCLRKLGYKKVRDVADESGYRPWVYVRVRK